MSISILLSTTENLQMDKNKRRVDLLRTLVSQDGGPAEFSRKRSRIDADKPIDPTYVSQILNGHRSFGEKAAENMCRRAGLPIGYFDQDSIDKKTVIPNKNNNLEHTTKQILSSEAQEAAEIISNFLPIEQLEILHWLRVEAIRRRHTR